MRAYVKLLPEPTTLEGVELAVKQSSVSTIHGQERRNVFMIALSVDGLGEVAGRAPHRRPPVEFDVLRKLVQGALLGRGGHRESEESPVQVPPGDIVSLHDGGRSQVQAMFMDLWKPTHKLLGTIVKHSAVDVKVKKVHVVLHEETVRQLKTRVRGGNPYTLVHTATYTSEMELVPDMCPEKARSIYPGYNVGDALAFVNLEMYSKVWQAEVQKKRDIYGARMVTLKDSGDQDAGPAPNKEDLQPVFYHQLPPDYHIEVIHSFNVVGVLDLTAGGGQLAQACLTKRIPYLGFGLTEVHVVELEKYLIAWVKDMMGTEGHPLCRKGFAAAKAVAQPDRNRDAAGEDKDKKDKTAAKDKKQKKKRKQSSEESEDDSDKDKKKTRRQSVKKNRRQSKKRSSDESGSSDSF